MSECDSESIISESETRELVQEDHKFTNSSLYFHFDEINLRSESPETTLESHLNSVKLESDDTPGFTPELSGKEKIGLVQRITNTLKTIGDFLMSPFRASKIVDKDSLSTSSGSLTSLASQERAATPPPSYDTVMGNTQWQRDAINWRERFSSRATEKSFEKRLEKEGKAVDEKKVKHTLV